MTKKIYIKDCVLMMDIFQLLVKSDKQVSLNKLQSTNKFWVSADFLMGSKSGYGFM